jgi:ribonuclease-3
VNALRIADDLPVWVDHAFGFTFGTPTLCETALRHRSAGGEHNERLEFLGDAVLNATRARLLFDAHPEADEGVLTRLRASLVSGATLAQLALELGVGDHLRLGAGEVKSGGFRNASILADALEALLGAIYLDAGFEAVGRVIARIYGERVHARPGAELKDPKSRLQEQLQGHGEALPSYLLKNVSGEPPHQVFNVVCTVAALQLSVQAHGGSRRAAEQTAASKMLELLPAGLRRS